MPHHTYGHCLDCGELSADLCADCQHCPECECRCVRVERDVWGRREDVNVDQWDVGGEG